MPRKNTKKREKAIRTAMGNLRRKKNPALERAEKSAVKWKAASAAHASAGRYSSDDTAGTVTGVFSYSGRGYGFCTPDEEFVRMGYEDVFIPPRQTRGAMTGDRVTVSVEPAGVREDGRQGFEG